VESFNLTKGIVEGSMDVKLDKGRKALVADCLPTAIVNGLAPEAAKAMSCDNKANLISG
jgi:hypothetical protein